MPLLIDAYNVLHCCHLLPEPHHLVSGRGLARLIHLTGLGGPRATVVCDGKPKPDDDPAIDIGNVELIYSGPDRDADSVIEQFIAESSAPRRLIVVSNDHRIQQAAKRRKAKVLASESFTRRLAAAIEHYGDTPATPEKPTRADAEKWMQRFGLTEPDRPITDEDRDILDAETTYWLREFGLDDQDDTSD